MTLALKLIDFRLLEELQLNSDRSLKEFSKILDVPKSTIHAKLEKFRRKNIILKESISLNFEVMNLPIIAFIMINFNQQNTALDQEEVADQLSQLPNVLEVHLLAGEWDILCKVRMKNINDLGDFSTKKLKSIEGIGRSLTIVVLKMIKENSPIMLSEMF